RPGKLVEEPCLIKQMLKKTNTWQGWIYVAGYSDLTAVEIISATNWDCYKMALEIFLTQERIIPLLSSFEAVDKLGNG
ncbi:hypothetical protein FKM82_020424, partial [Ascaphus truei]